MGYHIKKNERHKGFRVWVHHEHATALAIVADVALARLNEVSTIPEKEGEAHQVIVELLQGIVDTGFTKYEEED